MRACVLGVRSMHETFALSGTRYLAQCVAYARRIFFSFCFFSLMFGDRHDAAAVSTYLVHRCRCRAFRPCPRHARALLPCFPVSPTSRYPRFRTNAPSAFDGPRPNTPYMSRPTMTAVLREGARFSIASPSLQPLAWTLISLPHLPRTTTVLHPDAGVHARP